MIEYYFESAVRMRQMRHGPLAQIMDEMATNMRQQGYAAASARSILALAGKFNLYLHHWGVSGWREIDASHFTRFMDELQAEGQSRGVFNAMNHIKRHLRTCGVIVDSPEPVGEASKAAVWKGIVDRYDAWGERVCGLAEQTRQGYRRIVSCFLGWCETHRDVCCVEHLTAGDVLAFIEDPESHARYKDNGRHCHSALRVFLRFLHGAEITSTDLSRVIPCVPKWKLATIPRHLSMEKIRALVDSVDTSTSDGKRDRAVLTTLAFLGLRSQEVRLMKLVDLNWRKGELLIPKTKSAQERRLPIPHVVGVALADYILNGRPLTDSAFVFLRHRAPEGPLETPGAIGGIIFRRLKASGIDAPCRGAYLFRHSFASGMVNGTVSIKEIADALGHASIDTTRIYTKVDTTHLRDAALPFPEGGAS